MKLKTEKLTSDQIQRIKRDRVIILLRHTEVQQKDLRQLVTHFESQKPFQIITASVLLQSYYNLNGLTPKAKSHFVELILKCLEKPICNRDLHHDLALECLLRIQPDAEA